MTIPLPKLSHPTFELTLPSSGKKLAFRPMQTRERKVMLLALESNDVNKISRAVEQIIVACAPEVQYKDLPVFDVEYIFIQLIINSIKDTIRLEVRIDGRDEHCADCGKPRLLSLDLNDAKVEGIIKDKKSFQIDVGNGVGIKLRYPTEANLASVDAEAANKSEVEISTDLISVSIESLFDSNTTFPFSEYTYTQKIDFLDSLPPAVTDKLEEFVKQTPRLSLDFNVECPTCKTKKKHKISGLASFFV